MGVILTIAAASIGIPLAAIGIVALGNHLAFRPRVEDPPPVSYLTKMNGDRE
jgi:hypothetical protein